jgi:phosphopentomutase
MGGKPLNWKIIRKNIKSVIDIYGNKIIGIDIPKTGMYNDDYKVFHIGIELKDSKHVLTLLKKYKKQVALIGKVSDLFKKFGNYNLNATNIDNVLDVMADCIKERKYSFVFANVQEIDLHGHAQDVYKCADALKTLDIKIPMILNNMLKDDILIIVGDHGNDPCIGHSYHTREYVPLVIIGNNIRPGFLGGNIPLGNIGATIADFCNVPLLDKNKSLI